MSSVGSTLDWEAMIWVSVPPSSRSGELSAGCSSHGHLIMASGTNTEHPTHAWRQDANGDQLDPPGKSQMAPYHTREWDTRDETSALNAHRVSILGDR